MARVEMTDGWEEHLQSGIGALLEKLAVSVEADAKAVCPVDTGDLKASITHEVHDGVARVGSNLDYAAAVEMGFHGIEHVREYEIKRGSRAGTRVRAHERRGNTPSQPYLRPALYRKRDA
jgi:phage gpG-like protein